jgi:hypothetical protein
MAGSNECLLNLIIIIVKKFKLLIVMRLPEAYLEEVLVRDDHFVFFEIQG